MFKYCQRLPTGIHFNIKLISKTHISYWQEIKGNRFIFQLLPYIRYIFEALINRIQHYKHGADSRIIFPVKRKPCLILYVSRKRSFKRWHKLHKLGTEISCPITCFIAEPAEKCVLVIRNFFLFSRIPMQEEQRCQTLLTIQRRHSSFFINVTVNKVKGNRLPSNSPIKCLKKTTSYSIDVFINTSLSVVSLNKGDYNFIKLN